MNFFENHIKIFSNPENQNVFLKKFNRELEGCEHTMQSTATNVMKTNVMKCKKRKLNYTHDYVIRLPIDT